MKYLDPAESLARPQKIGLCLLLLSILLFGIWVEFRGAFLHSRMTDAGVYLRAAWAVRNGKDLYSITDDRGWHYVYPPLFAVAMSPLADPPARHEPGRVSSICGIHRPLVCANTYHGTPGGSHPCKGIRGHIRKSRNTGTTGFLQAMVGVTDIAGPDFIAGNRARRDARAGGYASRPPPLHGRGVNIARQKTPCRFLACRRCLHKDNPGVSPVTALYGGATCACYPEV